MSGTLCAGMALALIGSLTPSRKTAGLISEDSHSLVNTAKNIIKSLRHQSRPGCEILASPRKEYLLTSMKYVFLNAPGPAFETYSVLKSSCSTDIAQTSNRKH